MPTNIDEFTTTLTVEACLSSLKMLPGKYSSLALTISIVPLKSNTYQFEMFAKGVSRNWMNMRLLGLLQPRPSSSTQVSIEDIAPRRLGYVTQYLWIASPLFLMMAFVSSNPSVLLAIPAAAIFSLVTLVSKQQDKDEMLRIIHRELHPM
jgi:hypothetical protein